tara:strand:- start:649 stop:1212 length:564 start_codon:yes stop_codon:yes gene_type:complete
MDFYNEKGDIIDYTKYETCEINQANKYVKPDDCVLELGARYGGVSVAINNKLNNKRNQVSVEPDKLVWDALEKNIKNNNCEIELIKGTISKNKQKIIGKGWGTRTVAGGDIDNYEIPKKPFNVLIADCEGFLETFYRENTEFFKQLRLVIFEKDAPKKCDYDFIIAELLRLGFKEQKGSFHSVFIKD